MDNAKEALKQAWSEFLERYRWDFFLTVTFRSVRHPHHADSTLREIGKVIEGCSEGRYFLGSELHVNRTLHVHGLFQAPHGPTSNAARIVTNIIWKECFDRFGRTEVRRVRSNQAVSDYVTKYVTKELTSWSMRL